MEAVAAPHYPAPTLSSSSMEEAAESKIGS